MASVHKHTHKHTHTHTNTQKKMNTIASIDVTSSVATGRTADNDSSSDRKGGKQQGGGHGGGGGYGQSQGRRMKSQGRRMILLCLVSNIVFCIFSLYSSNNSILFVLNNIHHDHHNNNHMIVVDININTMKMKMKKNDDADASSTSANAVEAAAVSVSNATSTTSHRKAMEEDINIDMILKQANEEEKEEAGGGGGGRRRSKKDEAVVGTQNKEKAMTKQKKKKRIIIEDATVAVVAKAAATATAAGFTNKVDIAAEKKKKKNVETKQQVASKKEEEETFKGEDEASSSAMTTGFPPKKEDDDKKNNHRTTTTVVASSFSTDAFAFTAVPVSFFDDSHKKDKDCWLSIANATFMGCGAQGQAFRTTMHCLDSKNTDTETEASSSSSLVVLKIATTIAHIPEVYKPTDAKVSREQRMYRTLFPPSSTTSGNNDSKMRQRFHLTMGTVQIPVDKLYSTLSNNMTNYFKNDDRKLQRCQQPKVEEDLVVTGTICDVAKGIPLSDFYQKTKSNSQAPPGAVAADAASSAAAKAAANTTTTTATTTSNNDHSHRLRLHKKRIILKQLICIWRHMYKQRFLHDDMVFRHIYLDVDNNSNDYNNNIVSLIDFQGSEMLDDYNNINNNEGEVIAKTTNKTLRDYMKHIVNIGNSNKVRMLLQMVQLYQLLKILANICMDSTNYMTVHATINGHLNQNLRVYEEYPNSPMSNMERLLNQLRNGLKKGCDDVFNNNEEEEQNHHQQPTTNNNSSFSFPLLVRYGIVDVQKNNTIVIKSNAIPTLLYDHYKEVLFQNTSTFDSKYDDVDDVVVGQIYDILSQWADPDPTTGGDDGKC